MADKGDTKPTSSLVRQISMPPETVEFDSFSSLHKGKLENVKHWDSVNSGVGGDSTSAGHHHHHHHQPQIRGREATIDFYKVRTRAGSIHEVLASKPRLTDSSPNESPRRAKSSDNITNLSGVDMAMIEEQSISSDSSQRAMSPIDWEAIDWEAVADGNIEMESKVYCREREEDGERGGGAKRKYGYIKWLTSFHWLKYVFLELIHAL